MTLLVRLACVGAIGLGLGACPRASSSGTATAPGRPATAPLAEAERTAAERTAAEIGPAEGLTVDLDLAHERLTLAQAAGDAALLSRARFDLAEAYATAAAGLDVARFDLEEQRAAEPSRPRPDLDRLDTELRAQQTAWLDRAAVTYAAVLAATDPAAVELRPRARFGLADVQRRQGDRAASHDTLVALVHDDPEHALAGAALLGLADEAFEGQRLSEARALYERVVALGRDERHYARYKLGWVALDLDDAQSALGHWVAVAVEARADPRHHRLASAAAKDCVLAYARVGRPEKARAFFVRIDPAGAELLLQRLASIYEAEGRPADAAAIRSAAPLERK